MDIRRDIEDIRFVASLTDSTIRGYESAPYLPDAIVTADKRVTGELRFKISSRLSGMTRILPRCKSILCCEYFTRIKRSHILI